ncbi:hypothetical protein ElyMa_006519500 [Elysia marginata]|uniref:Uncharacterized protein n=1 Tax=Elysia marginata TaxID=1093978 RepID=A0AAV4I4P9_9GAST|nr:hypothetical protein ElyMa_006519500 [Elysia marginata]
MWKAACFLAVVLALFVSAQQQPQPPKPVPVPAPPVAQYRPPVYHPPQGPGQPPTDDLPGHPPPDYLPPQARQPPTREPGFVGAVQDVVQAGTKLGKSLWKVGTYPVRWIPGVQSLFDGLSSLTGRK